MLTKLVPDIKKTAELVEEISAACREQDLGRQSSEPGYPAARQGDPAERRRRRGDVGHLGGAGGQAEQLQESIAFFRIGNEARGGRTAAAGTRAMSAAPGIHVGHITKTAKAAPAKRAGGAAKAKQPLYKERNPGASAAAPNDIRSILTGTTPTTPTSSRTKPGKVREAAEGWSMPEFLAAPAPPPAPFTVPPDRPVIFREATPTEVARILGDWGRLEARSPEEYSHDFRRESLDQADKLYERIFARKEDDPLFLAGFGLYELQAEDNLRARNALKAATAAGVVRPRAYVELARLRLEESLPSGQEGIGDLSRDEFAEIVALLNTARLQMPSLRSTYFVLARAFEHAPSKPTLGDLWPLSEGVRLFPQNSNLAYSVATLYRRLGYADEAASHGAPRLRVRGDRWRPLALVGAPGPAGEMTPGGRPMGAVPRGSSLARPRISVDYN